MKSSGTLWLLWELREEGEGLAGGLSWVILLAQGSLDAEPEGFVALANCLEAEPGSLEAELCLPGGFGKLDLEDAFWWAWAGPFG